MKYIDIKFKRYNDQGAEISDCTLEDAINDNQLMVLLGPPGSGKTSILKKYYEEHPSDTTFKTVKELLKLKENVLQEETKILLLDGLDEYRSVETDKSFVIIELSNKIKTLLAHTKIIISCREMDWFGEYDTATLKNEVEQAVGLYNILPLNDGQKHELAQQHAIADIDGFINKFSGYGFLDNPQMFCMLAEIYKNNAEDMVKNKSELYLTFIKNAKEKNPNNTRNNVNVVGPEVRLKYLGYIAFYYMFCDIENCQDENFIEEISDSGNGYERATIQAVLNSPLISEGQFTHRTIAEFALAYFIKTYKLEDEASISVERIKRLFIKNNRIPTELRGTFAWICSLTGQEDFIKVDPYYQAIHGDNASFDNELKKRVVLAVKEYAMQNPRFFNFEQSRQMEGFYNQELDDFLIKEFKEALDIKNYYIYFLIAIITSGTKLSPGMLDFIKTQVKSDKVPCRYKKKFIKCLNQEIDFLREVLEGVRHSKLPDDGDILKEQILKILYPSHIGYDKIAEYLTLYKNRVVGYCYFLYDTKYEEKFRIIDDIYKACQKNHRRQIVFPENVAGFIEDYFLETCLKYEDELSAEEIYKRIKNFRQYYEDYEIIKFNSYRYEITEKVIHKQEKLTQLTNELFSLFLDDQLKNEDVNAICPNNFHYFFSYREATRRGEILLSKIDSHRKQEVNEKLFAFALYFGADINQCERVAKDFGFEDILRKFKNPQKTQWQIEDENRKQEDENEKQKILTNNEKHFSETSDEQIEQSFSDLFFISQLVYFNNLPDKEFCLKPDTFERLKGLLKKAIHSKKRIDPELLTIESLAKDSVDAGRNIDTLYYSSCIINSEENFNFNNSEFCKYLYINCLAHRKNFDINKSDYSKYFEHKEPGIVAQILKEYIALLLKNHLPEYQKSLIKYINEASCIEKLKSILIDYVDANTPIHDSLLYNFLNTFAFAIEPNDLKSFVNKTNCEKNKNIISALLQLRENREEEFSLTSAIAIHSIFKYNNDKFNVLERSLKVKIIDYMMNEFNTEDMVKHVEGFQSSRDECASFLKYYALGKLTLDELELLKECRTDCDDIWTTAIIHQISIIEQNNADQQFSSESINKLKNFIISSAIVSKADFFADVCLKIESLKKEIEGNRNNDKNSFYSQDGSSKAEEACRDVIFHRLKDKYGYTLEFTKEKCEAENRADLNIKYKGNERFEVQVECKRGNNPEIYTGISVQLIPKYISSKVSFGIYLVFYFGIPKNLNIMLKKINADVSPKYNSNINVICINLVK